MGWDENALESNWDRIVLTWNFRLPTGADGDPGNITTLNHVLNLYGNGPNRTISEVMDIWNGELCYEYKDY